MFYNRKILFFVIMYAFGFALYYFVRKQLILTGMMSGPIVGSAIIFLALLFVCFVISIAVSFLIKCSYGAFCKIFGFCQKPMLFQTFWTLFTVLNYAAVFIIFLKMTEY